VIDMLSRIATAFAGLLLVVSGAALAQGGPPLVTDDPGTPEAGHWEINLAGIYARTHDRRDLALPDMDINYGYGGHIQLKVDVPWAFAQEGDGSWKSGLGAIDAGVKWRFLDADKAGFSMSTYPQVLFNALPSSAHRGITSSDKQFLLPVEAATEYRGVGLDAEVGRNFVQNGPDEWVLGGIVAPKCTEKIECLLEVHERWTPHTHATLVNLGLRWDLAEGITLLGAVGREFGSADDLAKPLVYLGVQIVR
jgi:hypothetical protein